MSRKDQIGRKQFLLMLRQRFPEVTATEVTATFDESDAVLIHLEVAAFRDCVENAMDSGQMWNFQKYLAFVNEVLPVADSSLENALEISFIEDFALGGINDNRRAALRDRAPKQIREKIIAINHHWR